MEQIKKKEIFQESVKKLLAIKVGDYGFAIAIDKVREIVYHNKISPLPQSPDFVRGITKIRQETVPVLDLNMLLGDKKLTKIHSESCYITISLNGEKGKESQVCLLADHVLQTYKIDFNEIDDPPVVGGKEIVTYIQGIFRIDEKSFIIIDPVNLISPFVNEVSRCLSERKINESDPEENISIELETAKVKKTKNKYLSVYSNHGENAFPLSMVNQISNKSTLNDYVDGDIPSFLYAATIINDKPVALIRLNDFFQSKEKSEDEKLDESNIILNDDSPKTREVVVLIEYQSGLLGIVVDNIGKTYDVDGELKQNYFCNEVERDRVKSLGFIDYEDSSIEVIDPTNLFIEQEHKEVKSWMKCVETLMKLAKPSQDTTVKEKVDNPYVQYAGSYLVVQVGNIFIALKSDDVDEILSYESLIPIAGGPEWCSGLLDLRQNTYPVIDLHNKLDIEIKENLLEERNVLVMIEYQNKKLGLLVDKIIQALHISPKELSGDENSELFVNSSVIFATAHCECGLVHIININEVIETDEVSAKRLLNELTKNNNELNLNSGKIT
ncbi:MAG: chemotaxis protein CheW [Woeseiaceae bacterium]